MGRLIDLYADWHSRLIPYYSFNQFVQKVEQVGASKRVRVRTDFSPLICFILEEANLFLDIKKSKEMLIIMQCLTMSQFNVFIVIPIDLLQFLAVT